ncbi:hypothetical protein GEMRC1_003897 [Eukaryota sp. GEM-RC1]
MTVMTAALLRDLCKKQKLYTTPNLNEVMYLHYQGFLAIDNLEPYTAIKSLWLEGNGLKSLNGLSAQTDLRCLYAQENCISKIDHISHLSLLDQLNLSNNFVSHLENLSTLPNLRALHLKKNQLSDADSIRHLIECPSISVLDLSDNVLDDTGIIEVLEQMPNLKVLKTLLSTLPNLTYLDDRPVFDAERMLVKAWAEGGLEAEQKERERQRVEKLDKDKQNMQAFREKFCNNTNIVDDTDDVSDDVTTDDVASPMESEPIGDLKEEALPELEEVVIEPFSPKDATVEELEDEEDSFFITQATEPNPDEGEDLDELD